MELIESNAKLLGSAIEGTPPLTIAEQRLILRLRSRRLFVHVQPFFDNFLMFVDVFWMVFAQFRWSFGPQAVREVPVLHE